MQTKKVVSVLLAGVTTLSMAMPVLAANGDPNLVVTPDTKYSTPIQADSEVTLGLMPANSYYQRTGFDSADAAANGLEVSKINLGADKISSVFTYGSKTVDGLYAGTVTVKGKKGQYGPASLHIVNKNNTSAGIDMTVYVEADTVQDDVTVASVEAVDLRDGGTTYEYAGDLNVEAAEKQRILLMQVLVQHRVTQLQAMHCIVWQKQTALVSCRIKDMCNQLQIVLERYFPGILLRIGHIMDGIIV